MGQAFEDMQVKSKSITVTLGTRMIASICTCKCITLQSWVHYLLWGNKIGLGRASCSHQWLKG